MAAIRQGEEVNRHLDRYKIPAVRHVAVSFHRAAGIVMVKTMIRLSHAVAGASQLQVLSSTS